MADNVLLSWPKGESTVEPRGQRDLPEYSFDPVVLADWLKAPVAMLSQPPGLVHFASNESHSLFGHAPDVPVAITIEHRLDSADHLAPGPGVMANVRTRFRQARGEDFPCTVERNIAEAVHDYLQGSAARHGIPLRPSARPAGLDEALRAPLAGWSWRDVTLDGAELRWERVISQDYATDEQLIGVGGAVGAMQLVAVVGPTSLFTGTIGLVLHHPQ